MKRFEVWLVNLDPTGGGEIRKTRPAVIVSPGRAGARRRTRSRPPVSHASPKALAIISEIDASTNIPCAIVPPNCVLAAKAGSVCSGLPSPPASA